MNYPTPLPITVCERCRATEAACDATRLYSGRPCCQSCDHDETTHHKKENQTW